MAAKTKMHYHSLRVPHTLGVNLRVHFGLECFGNVVSCTGPICKKYEFLGFLAQAPGAPRGPREAGPSVGFGEVPGPSRKFLGPTTNHYKKSMSQKASIKQSSVCPEALPEASALKPPNVCGD